jgi:predicted DNA-binding protein
MGKGKTTKEKTPTQQIAVRLEAELLGRLDAVATKLSRPGLALTRTDAVRVCLLTGLQQIEKEK